MPEEQIRLLREQMSVLQTQLKLLNAALVGDESIDSEGMFKRLRALEDATERCEKNQAIELTALRKEIAEDFKQFELEQEQSFNMILKKLETNTTTISNIMMEVHMWKSVLSIFKSKYFWRVFVACMGLIAWGKSYAWIMEQITKIWNDLIAAI